MINNISSLAPKHLLTQFTITVQVNRLISAYNHYIGKLFLRFSLIEKNIISLPKKYDFYIKDWANNAGAIMTATVQKRNKSSL